MDDLYQFPVVTASDTVDAQSGVFSRIGDAVTKGIPNAAISGALSIYNTGLDYAGKEAIDTEQLIRSYDESYGDYYADNKQIQDFGGFIATSLIPGALGIKALKLAQAGTALGPISRVLNLSASNKQIAFNNALEQLAASGGTVTSAVRRAKNAELAWGLADATLQNAAFELAVVATMNDSPIFEGSDFGDFAANVGIGAVFGGAIGGLVSHVGTRGILKQAQLKIESNRRLFDSVFDPIKLGMTKSDEALVFAENILKLSDDFFSTNFEFKLGGKLQTKVLDTGPAFQELRTRAEKVAFDTLALKFNELAEGGEVTGQAMYKFILDRIKKGRDAGESPEIIADTVRGYLQGVKKVTNLTEESGTTAGPKQFFITQKPTGLNDLFSEVKGTGTGKQAYYLKTDDPTKIKFGSARLGYETAEEAFADGYDAVITKQGRVAINPKSQVISKTPDMAMKNKFYLDLEKGGLSSEVVLTGADLIKKPDDLKFFPDSLRIGKQEFKQPELKMTDLKTPSLEASTRFMWASKLPDTAFNKRTVHWTDFALLERMKTLPGKYTNSDLVHVQMPDGTLSPLSDIVNVPELVNRLKLDFLTKELGPVSKGYDLRYLSTLINAPVSWVEEAITSNFAATRNLIDKSFDFAQYFKPRTVEVEWDQGLKQAVQMQGPLGPNHMSTVVLSHHYNLVTHTNIQDNAFRSILGVEDSARFMESPNDLITGVSERGAGATTVGASNADYGRRAELFVQDVGKQVALVAQKWKDATIEALAPTIAPIRDSAENAAELGILTTALRRDPRKYYLVRDDVLDVFRLIDRDAVKMVEAGKANDYDEAIDMIRGDLPEGVSFRGAYDIKSKDVANFLEQSQLQNAARVEKQTTIVNATGLGRQLDGRAIYAPPVDTRRYPYFAYVVAKERVGNSTDVAMITAKTDAQLRELANQVGDEYEVVFKNDTKKFFKAQGVYDYSLQLNDSQVNSALQRKGILGDFFPETRAENVLEDYVRWHANSSDSLLRSSVQVKYRQFFNELNFLSEQYQSASLSAFKGVGMLRKAIEDPFADYAKTALNVSKQSEYPILDSLNEFVDKLGTRMYEGLDKLQEAWNDSRGTDLATLQQANDLIEQYGLNTPYKTMEAYLVANEKFPKNLIKTAFQKVNLWLATTVLRFDFANSLVNIVSTPIMLGTELASIKTLIGNDPELAGKLADLMHVTTPGSGTKVPSTTKLISQAVQNYFGKDKLALIDRYRTNGDIKDVSRLYHEILDDLAYQPGVKVSDFSKKVDAAVEKGAKITGNTFSEELTRFVSADVMRQLSDPLVVARKMTVQEQNAYISTFVNRVQGNYIASQRPILFQGTTGAAIGLFQTYAFNVLQQLFRHVESRDTRALLTFAGLQQSVYGMNGLPFFDAINQHIIGNASGNSGHTDAYSLLPAANKELGDWLLYGTASAFPLFGEKSPALYSRGDINPRHLSIVPINPLDIPAVAASIKLADSIAGFGKNVAKGADISTAMLQALEHHGWNRPLAGFAQSLAGQSTTSKGGLISAANDLETTTMLARIQDRVVEFGGVQRVFGAKPMDEAVALNNLYRNKTYEATDRARLEALGQAVKTKLGKNQQLEDGELEDFMLQYAKSGGRIETFSSSLQRWTRDSNVSIVNQMASKLGSPQGQKLQMILGGEKLQDYSTIAESPIEPAAE